MTKNKKIIIFVIIALVLALTATTGTILVLNLLPKKEATHKTVPKSTKSTKASADSLKAKAIEALNNKDTTKAKTLFRQAQQQYQDIGDTKGVTDIGEQLFLVDHPDAPKSGAKTVIMQAK